MTGVLSDQKDLVSSNMPSKDSDGITVVNGNGCCNNETDVNVTKWCPLDPLDVKKFTVGKYALVILHRPILIQKEVMINLWNNANIRMTVDGGTARWYDYCKDIKSTDLTCLHPHIVSGDFDSLPQAVIDLAKKNGCEIVRTPDQNYTDFRKALQILHDKDFDIDSVIAVVENSGRLDQTLANLNTHFSFNSIFRNRKVNLYSLAGDAITWLLRPGKHSISIPQRLRDSSSWCGLLPVGNPCVITTSGLRYNTQNRKLEFGGLVSSSNTYNGNEEVVIETDENVVWSMGLDLNND